MKRIYFDNAATSFPKAENLSQAVFDFIDNGCVNINRSTYALSSELLDVVLDTRVMLSELFDCADDPTKFCKRIIFTSGVTQSVNIFLRGILSKGDHIVTGAMEHHAVMRTLYDLKDSIGISFDIAPCNEYGVVEADSVEKLIRSDTKAVIINHASNVFGTVSPIEKIGQVCKRHNIFFAVDTAQTAGVLDISMRKACIDFLAFSGHKGLLALQGIGGFAISEKLEKSLKVTVTGGTGSVSHSYSQPDYLPDKFESGTLNLCGIIALNHSLKFLKSIGIENIRKKEQSLRNYFIDKLKDVSKITLYCTNKDIPSTATVSLSFDTVDNAVAASILEEKFNIMTRCGLHCALSAHKAMNTVNTGTVRFSFGYYNTFEEIDYCVSAIKSICDTAELI